MFGIFNMRTHVNKYMRLHTGAVRTNTVGDSALKVDSGRNISCRTVESNPRQYCALLFGPRDIPPHGVPSQEAFKE